MAAPAASAKPGPDFVAVSVLSNTVEALEQHRLVLDVGRELLGMYRHPGQFVQAKRRAEDKPGFFAIASAPITAEAGQDGQEAGLELLLKASGPVAESLCRLQAGDTIWISQPMGQGFRLESVPPADYPSILLFATGSGISPIRALIESGALRGRRSVRLYYGARTPEHMAFAGSIAAWGARHGVSVVPVFSSEGAGYVQHVFARDEDAAAGAAGTAAVLCGRREMTQEVTQILKGRGVDAILLNY